MARRLRRVQVREEKARETDDLADPRLPPASPERPVWVQHDDTLLHYLQVAPHQQLHIPKKSDLK